MTTPTDAQMKLADVTQADRDLWKYLLDAPKSQCTMMDTCDPATDELQAIARHRQATEARAQGLVEALEDVLPFTQAEELAEAAQVRLKKTDRDPVRKAVMKARQALSTWRRT